jgi:hypothetical protein
MANTNETTLNVNSKVGDKATVNGYKVTVVASEPGKYGAQRIKVRWSNKSTQWLLVVAQPEGTPPGSVRAQSESGAPFKMQH